MVEKLHCAFNVLSNANIRHTTRCILFCEVNKGSGLANLMILLLDPKGETHAPAMYMEYDHLGSILHDNKSIIYSSGIENLILHHWVHIKRTS